MDRQAFKQRMQELKSYREQNPGKGYWDWRVQAYENAGETGLVDERTDHPVTQRIELDKQIELANYIDKINHTDKNGDYNPFYSNVDDTYGTVELPIVQVTAPLTVQGDDGTDHPIEKPKMPTKPIKRVYTINQGKPDDSQKKWDKDGDGDLSPEERWERQKSERRKEDWKKIR